jgi:hypothetical protein
MGGKEKRASTVEYSMPVSDDAAQGEFEQNRVAHEATCNCL